MPDPVSTIRNLGPKSDASFARAGIADAETLRDLGPDEAYKRLIASGSRPHFIGYYALVMGLQGRPWNDCQGAEKEALRQRFDKLKAAAHKEAPTDLPRQPGQLPLALEAVLNEIGVRPAKA